MCSLRRVTLLIFFILTGFACDLDKHITPIEPIVPEPMGKQERAIPVPQNPSPDVFRLPKTLQSTESGLKYFVEEAGTGVQAKRGQLVTIHYSGWRMDGAALDSSKKRRPPKPAIFPLGEGNEIPGWTEGIAMMRVGAKWWFVVPPELGYGARDLGKIPANSTLVYRIELYEVR